MSRMLKKYNSEVKQQLQKKFGYVNPMLIPSLKKIVISMGLGEATKDKNSIQDCVKELTLLSGQKPILTKAKKAISNFKLREGQIIGAKVTLRKKRMWDFFDRFCNIVAPRIRDFRGFPENCDGNGNFTLGLQEQIVFPELNLDEIKRTQGMHITFVTTAVKDAEGLALLKSMGLPFKSLGQETEVVNVAK